LFCYPPATQLSNFSFRFSFAAFAVTSFLTAKRLNPEAASIAGHSLFRRFPSIRNSFLLLDLFPAFWLKPSPSGELL